MTGPTPRPTPGPIRPGQPRPASAPTRKKANPPVIAASGLLVVLGFLALTSWLGLLWAAIAAAATALAGTAGHRMVKKRRDGTRRPRTGGNGGGLFPGLRRNRSRRSGPTGTGSRGRSATGRKTGTGIGSRTGTRTRSRVGTSGRPKGLRGMLGKSSRTSTGSPTGTAGRSRNLLRRNPARAGVGTAGSKPAGQSRFRNLLKRFPAVGTSARTGSAGAARSRNPLRRTAGTPRSATGAASGGRMRNLLKRRSAGTGTSAHPGIGTSTPRGTGIADRRRGMFRRKSSTGTPAVPGRPTAAPRRGLGNMLKRTPASNPIVIRRGTPTPPRPTRAQVKEGIRVQQTRRLADAKKASGQRTVSGWLGRLGQPKAPKSTATTAPAPAKAAPPPVARPAAPSRPAPPVPGRKDARWSVGTGQDEEPGRRPTPPPAPKPPQREAPTPERTPRHKICPDHGANCTVDHEANRYGYKHDQPGRVPTTGGNRMTHAVQSNRRDYDDMGLVAFVNAQGDLHEDSAALAEKGKRMLAAADNQPLAPEVRANLEQYVAILTTAAGASEALVPAARRHHEADFARAEEPRGSRTQEKNADVAKTEADGF